MKRFGMAMLLALVAWTSPALAQTGIFPAPVYSVWVQTGRVNLGLNAGVATARVAFTTTGPTAYVCNRDASNTAFIQIGISTVNATVAGSFPLYAGWCVPLNMRPNNATTYTHLAAITSSGTAQLDVMTGIGSPGSSGGGSGGGGGGGSVTQGTTPWVDNVTQWASTALGAPSNYGTSPGAVVVPGFNAFVTNTVAVTGPLTDTQLRASGVPVTGTFFQATQPVSGPLTDAQLRATAVPVSGTVTATGPLTDTQLRAASVPVSAASLPLPTGAATEATLLAINTNVQAGAAATGAAVPPSAIYMGVNVGGNLTGMTPGVAGTASSQVWSVQGAASMTKLLVTPDSVALPANQSVNAAQWGATTLGTPTNFGTTPGAVIAGSVNASLFFGTAAVGATNPIPVVPAISTVTTSITRPADTTAYAANDNFSNSTSAPTAGGFTFTSTCRASGGSGLIKSAVVSASAGTSYQGEVWVFDQAVTAVNDNAAFTVSDSDILNLVGVIPFTTSDVTAANAISYVTQLDIGYTCVGTTNLRYLVKIMAAITPASAEVLTVRLQVVN